MTQETITTKAGRKAPRFRGKVVSDRMHQTIVVAVETLKTHSKYRKQYRSTKRYKVHDEENKYKAGDVVTFQECRPVSRGKRHKVVTE